MVRRPGLLWVGLILLLLAAGLGIYWSGGSTAILQQSSPDGRERVEFVTPTRGQALFLDYEMPARARLVAGGKVLGTSAPFELSGQGEVFWEKDVVQVGTSAVFDRSTGKWDVIQQ